jgi:hypothetical protein
MMTMAKPRKLRLDKEALFRRLNYAPTPGQLKIHRSKALRRVVACGVRWGKSTLAAHEAIAAAMQPQERSIGWVCAPSYDLSRRVFDMIIVAVKTHLSHRIVWLRESEHRLMIYNMAGGKSEIRCKSAESKNSLLGEGLNWLIVDEASRLRPSIWESHLSQRLLDKRGWALLISTPHGRGPFYDMWKLGQGADPEYESWNEPSWTNPRLDREAIERERARVPVNVFNQEYGAQFLDGESAVFRNVRALATGEWQEPVEGERYFAGLDLAKSGDFSVLTILNRAYEVVHVERMRRLDFGIQITRFQEALRRYNRAPVLVDSTGAGEPVLEMMRSAGMDAEGFVFTVQSKKDLVQNLQILLEKKRIVLPKATLAPEMIDELQDYEFTVLPTGHTRMSAPPGANDDCVVSLGLAAWNRKNAPGPIRFIRCNSIEEVQAFIDRCQ